MHELTQARKNKVCLEDYNYRQEIENRLLMARFSTLDLEVLEEILYSSIKVSISQLAKTLDLGSEEIHSILTTLSKTGLFTFEEDLICIDKDMRKYFEMQLLKFDPEFKPGMEFLQSLLKRVPISILPAWYSIPRTSNNIFDSIVEKYLLTPQIFNRYLSELNFSNPILNSLMQDVYNAQDFMLLADHALEKYGITHEQFEEYILELEFHFVCCLSYRQIRGKWKEVVTPFYEWKEYLTFLKESEVPSISPVSTVKPKRPHYFSFIEDMTLLLNLAKKQPFSLTDPSLADKLRIENSLLPEYIKALVSKLSLLKCAKCVKERLHLDEEAENWLEMENEERALLLYRNPLSHLSLLELPAHLCTEKLIREAEKSILRVLDKGWVYYEAFERSLSIHLGPDSVIILKKMGKMWKYTLPVYSEEELCLVKTTLFTWLFEMGITAIGEHEGKECFCVTPFGQTLFGR